MLEARRILKARTEAAHIAVDAAYSELDLSQPIDFKTFLHSHYLAYKTIDLSWNSNEIIDTKQIVTLLENDLASLGEVKDLNCPLNFSPILEPLGVSYVLAGSHFGKYILTKRWQMNTDKNTLSAGRYMTSNKLKESWGKLTQALSAAPSDRVAQAAVDANATFDLFHRSLKIIMARRSLTQPY